jgi:hypothetical protein
VFAAGLVAPLASAEHASADEAGAAEHGGSHLGPAEVVLPKPIPGGSTLPDDTLIHVLGPGPSDIKLPFSGGFLGGDDVDTVTITDFEGFSAVAFHAGTALGSDGAMYNLETDMRAFQGRYIGEDGDVHEGCFALV